MSFAEQNRFSLFVKNRLAGLKIISSETIDPDRHVQNIQLSIDLSMRAAELRALGESDNAKKMQELANGYRKL